MRPEGAVTAPGGRGGEGHSLVQQGCYTCLKEALAIYDKHAAAKVPIPGAREGQFEAALLIAIREGELGIPNEAAWARARSLVLPARQAVLDAAELIIGDTTSLDPEQRAQRTGVRGRPPVDPDNPKRRALDAALEKDYTARYVALSIDCEQQKLIESVDMKALTAAYAGVPLIQFRLSTCGRPRRPRPARSADAIRGGRTRSTGRRGTKWSRRSDRQSTCRRSSACTGRAATRFRHR